MKDVLAVYLADTAYQERFTEYLVHTREVSCPVVSFTELNTARQYLLEEEVQLLILDQDSTLPKEAIDSARQRIYLSEQIKPVRVENEYGAEQKVIYRYQSMQVIVEAIQQIYLLQKPSVSFLKESIQIKTRTSHLIGIWTAADVMDLSGIAYLYCLEQRKSQEIIYLNLSQFENFSYFTNQQNQKSLSDFIYYLKQSVLEEPEKLSERLTGCLSINNGIHYLNPVDHGLDLLDLGAREMDKLLKALIELEQFDQIIVAGSILTEGTLELFKQCEVCYLLSGTGELSKRKNQSFYRQLQQLLGEEGMTKVRQVTLPEEIRFSQNAGKSQLQKAGQEVCQRFGLADGMKEGVSAWGKAGTAGTSASKD